MCSVCFEAELSKERNADSQENVSAVPIAPITDAEKHVAPIRLRSFIPRSRSKVVFALVMACYSVTLGRFVSAWAYVAHVRSPPRAFYLRGSASDVVSLLVFAPLIESLILVGVFELVRRARAPAVVQVFIAALFISEMHVWPLLAGAHDLERCLLDVGFNSRTEQSRSSSKYFRLRNAACLTNRCSQPSTLS
jgi:hypothetical protein